MTVTSEDESKGTVTGAGNYEYGDTVSIAATASVGYTFDGWYEGETKVSSDSTYSFTAEDKTLVAKWTLITYTITATSEDESKGTVSGSGTYGHGASVTLRATAKTGYTFDGWYVAEIQVCSDETYVRTASENKTLTAKWTTTTYTISVNVSHDNAGTVTGAGSYEHGESVTLTVTTNLHFEFLGWYDGDRQLGADSTYTFTATESKTITAKWKLKDNSNPNGGWTGIV